VVELPPAELAGSVSVADHGISYAGTCYVDMQLAAIYGGADIAFAECCRKEENGGQTNQERGAFSISNLKGQNKYGTYRGFVLVRVGRSRHICTRDIARPPTRGSSQRHSTSSTGRHPPGRISSSPRATSPCSTGPWRSPGTAGTPTLYSKPVKRNLWIVCFGAAGQRV
jgi:hypothetical protein